MKLVLRIGLVLAVMVSSLVFSHVPSRAAAEPTRVMVVGDSISQGSANDCTWRLYLARHLIRGVPSWPGAVFVGDRGDLYDNVNERHGSYDYCADLAWIEIRQHHARWGHTLGEERTAIRAAVTANRPDVLLVMLGVNDLAWLGVTPAQLAGYMDEFIANARAANPSIKIIIGDVLSRYDFWGQKYIGREQAQDVNVRYAALAAARTTAGSPVRTAPAIRWDPKIHTWDGVHPNELGQEEIAETFAGTLHGFGIGEFPYFRYSSDPKRWSVSGPGIRLTSIDRGIRLDWNPVPGATGYLIEQRIDSLGQTGFTTLPVPMGGRTFTWTAKGLLPGWLASSRIIPVKGVTQGSPGPAATARVAGTPPTTQPALFGYPHNGSDNMTRLTWTAVANATGYYIEQMDLAAAVPTWDRLAWPVPTTSFDPGYLQPGHWYRFRVIPANGALFGPPSEPVDIRTTGAANYLRYYALGDSFSSGLGAGGYSGGACYRSEQAWPFVMRQSWEPEPIHLACASDTANELLANQWTRITDFPGTVLITLTIGGNDVGFGPVALECWRRDCTPQEPTIAARIDAMGPILRDVYRRLRVKAPGADIVVAGYPKLIMPPESANCSSIFGNGIPGVPVVADGFRDDEKRMVRRLAARLNGMIQRIGTEEDVVVAVNEVSGWFYGHEACAGAAGEYINQVDCGLLPPGCPGSLHPNAGGQLAYAYAVNQARRRLAEQGDVRY